MYWSRNISTHVYLKGYPPLDTQNALERVEKIRHLIISYAGYILQQPDMFPQPSGYSTFSPEMRIDKLTLCSH